MTVRCLLNMCATGSLLDYTFFEEKLSRHKGSEKHNDDASEWHTDNGKFKSRGNITICRARFPSFTMAREFNIKYDFLPNKD